MHAHGKALVTELRDRPGVLILPPLLYLATIVVGLLLHWMVPLVMPLPTIVRWAGGVLIAVSFALAISARQVFARAGTNVNPMEPTTALVRSGPFRWTRNPMYVSMNGALVGIALATRIGWFLILLPVTFAILHWGVVLREERYLTRKFGSEYHEYRAAVRRYL